MAKAKTTREVSTPHEDHIADLLSAWKGRRSPSSGANFGDPIDVTSSIIGVECKATEGKSISLKLDDWLAIRSKVSNGQDPAMALRFRDPFFPERSIDLLVVEADHYVELREELESAKSACNICEGQWPGHHPNCVYVENMVLANKWREEHGCE